MAGRPRGRDALNEVIRVRVTKEGRALIDKARGSLSVSNYVRALIKDDVDRRML